MCLNVTLFLLFYLKISQAYKVTNTSQQDTITNKSYIICDGGTVHDSCIGKTIICPDGVDCEIICDISTATDITDNKKCISETGCCATNIHCPSDKKCEIICSGGCKETNIYAATSSYLEIKNCDHDQQLSRYYWSTCHEMTIYCPFHGPCEFEGDFTIQSSHIHTLHGFTDIYLEYTVLLDSCVIFCTGDTNSQYNCLSNDHATQCIKNMTLDVCNSNASDWYYNYNESSSDEQYQSTAQTRNYNTMNISSMESNNEINDMTSMSGISAYFDPNNKLQMIGYGAVILLLLIPIFTAIVAIIHHSQLSGSDSPEYLAVFKCFINIADLYTDIIFCFVLYTTHMGSYPILFFCALIFTAIPHLISIIMAMWYIHKWRENRIAYIKRYDNLVIGLTVLAGFVPTIELLSSKLFYASRLTLQICEKERLKIQQFRFINNNIFENIPLIIIQILTAFDNKKSDINPITVIAFCFSVLSSIIGILTLISRCFIQCFSTLDNCNKLARNVHNKLMYKLDIKSSAIQTRHHFCHKLFAQCLCHAMETNDGLVETTSIIPIVDGISCKIEILSNHENNNNNIHALLNEIADNTSDAFVDFKTSLREMLSIIECDDLNVIITKLDLYGKDVIISNNNNNNNKIPKLTKRNSKNTYMPLRQASLVSLDQNNIINDTINRNRLSVSSCGDIIGEPSVISNNINHINHVNHTDTNIQYMSLRQTDGNINYITTNTNTHRESFESIQMTEKEDDSSDDNTTDSTNVYNTDTETTTHDTDTCDVYDETDNDNDDRFSINATKGSRYLSYESDIFSHFDC